MKLHRYWIKFKLLMSDPHPSGTLMGCGVTAFSQADALGLLQDRVFQSQPLPAIQHCVEDVKFASLDQKHVVPNVGDCARRGVWFPLGYDVPGSIGEVA